jgi:hypothetical protein
MQQAEGGGGFDTLLQGIHSRHADRLCLRRAGLLLQPLEEVVLLVTTTTIPAMPDCHR